MKNFRDWWINNHPLISRLSSLWFLPTKWKRIIKAIIAGVDAAINQNPMAFTNIPKPELDNVA